MADTVMRVYTETRSVTRPPALVERELRDRLGEPVDASSTAGTAGTENIAGTEGTAGIEGTDSANPTSATSSAGHPESTPLRWRYRRLLYRYEITLDPDRGRVETVVSVPSAFRPMALGVLPVTVLAILFGLSPDAYLLVLWACAVVALVPVVHLWPRVGASLEIESARPIGRRLTAASVPAFLGAMLALWAGLNAVQPGPVVDAMVVVLSAVGVGAYYAGNGLGIDDGRISALGVPVSALLPALFAAGNAVVATALLSGPVIASESGAAAAGAGAGAGSASGTAHPILAVALAGTTAVVFDLAFLVYCHVALQRFVEARLVPPQSRRARIAGAACFLGVNVVLLGATVLALSTLAAGLRHGTNPPLPVFNGISPIEPAYPTVDGVFAPLPGPARPYSIGFYAVLVAPVLYVGLGWGYYHLTGLVSRIGGLLRAERVTGRDLPDVPVFAIPGTVPRVRPLGRLFGLWGVVLVTEPVLELADDELGAVVAHEAYHVRRRDLAVGALAALAALAVGGRNALLAFRDYPAAERDADAHATERVGRDALVRALRRMESLHYEARRPLGDGPTAPPADPSVRSYLLAPYRLYFGRVLLDGAHRDTDERIARL